MTSPQLPQISLRILMDRITSIREQNQRDLTSILASRDNTKREMDECRIAMRFDITVSHQFECPVCFEPCLPFAVLHPCGHNFCGKCCEKLQQRQCPMCRKPFRHHTLVPMLTKLVEDACTYRCKGALWGCEFQGTVDDARAHAAQKAKRAPTSASSLSMTSDEEKVDGDTKAKDDRGIDGDVMVCAFQSDENANEEARWVSMAKIKLRPDVPWTLELPRPGATTTHRRVKVDGYNGGTVLATLLVPNAALKFLLQQPNSSRRVCDRSTPHNPSQCNLVHFRGDVLVEANVSSVMEEAEETHCPFLRGERAAHSPHNFPSTLGGRSRDPSGLSIAATANRALEKLQVASDRKIFMWVPSQLLQPCDALSSAISRPSQLFVLCDQRHSKPATSSPHMDPWRRTPPATPQLTTAASPQSAASTSPCPHLHLDDRKVPVWPASCPSSPFATTHTMMMRPAVAAHHASELERTRSNFDYAYDDDGDFDDDDDEHYEEDPYDDDTLMGYYGY